MELKSRLLPVRKNSGGNAHVGGALNARFFRGIRNGIENQILHEEGAALSGNGANPGKGMPPAKISPFGMGTAKHVCISVQIRMIHFFISRESSFEGNSKKSDNQSITNDLRMK